MNKPEIRYCFSKSLRGFDDVIVEYGDFDNDSLAISYAKDLARHSAMYREITVTREAITRQPIYHKSLLAERERGEKGGESK